MNNEIPKTMKAAVLYGLNDLRFDEVEVPEPGLQEVLVKVHACAICGSDPKVVSKGHKGSPPFGTFIPGHEYSGEIVASEIVCLKAMERGIPAGRSSLSVSMNSY